MTIKSVNCDGSSFAQTQFLGATVENFTSSVGWNSDRSSLTVTVVEDTCSANQKIVYSQPWGVASVTTNPDSFKPPQTGAPIWFQYGSFTYKGILQSWKQTNSLSGTKYVVQCSDAREITDSVEVILGGYNGPTFDMPNIANVYGFLEAYEQVLGVSCTIDSSLVSIMGYTSNIGFGGAQINDLGMTWNLIRNGLNNIYGLPIGNLIDSTYGGPRMNFKGWSYAIDITEVPVMPNWYRIQSDKMNLTDLIAQVCQDAGFDCYVEFVPNIATSTLTIKFKTVGRFFQPAAAEALDTNSTLPPANRLNLGTITSLVGNGTNQSPLLNKWIDTNERGVELRNETTNAMLVGENRHDIWQTPSSSIKQFWGTDISGNLITGQGNINSDDYSVKVNSSSWIILNSNKYPLTVGELRASIGGFDAWAAYVLLVEPKKAKDIGIEDLVRSRGGYTYEQLMAGVGFPSDAIDTSKESAEAAAKLNDPCGEAQESIADFINRIYSHVNNIATSIFGRTYTVELPNICIATDSLTGEKVVDYEMVSSGWPETPTILDLSVNGYGIEVFKNEDGRVQCFVKFNNATQWDLSELSPEDYYYESGNVWVRANAEDNIYWSNYNNKTGPHAVIQLVAPVFYKNCLIDKVPHHMALQALIAEKNGASDEEIIQMVDSLTKVGSNQSYGEIGRMPSVPVGAAIPLRSKTLCYGPWMSTAGTSNAYGPNGKSEFERDTSFAPWNFNGSTNMGVAALAHVNSKLTYTQVTELASVSAVGIPISSLGSLLISGGPNLTNVDVDISINGVRTSYRFRTYTPKFGLLTKQRIDNLRKTTEIQAKTRRQMNQARLKSNNFLYSSNYFAGLRRRLFGNSRTENRSPHQLICAQVTEDDSGDIRTHVVSSETNQELGNLYDNWRKAGGVGLNGIFRPFEIDRGKYEFEGREEEEEGLEEGESLAGSKITNFERLALHEVDYIQLLDGLPDKPIPKFYSKGQVIPSNNEDFIPITIRTLNPFQNNVSEFNYNDISASGGHDIEYVVRGTSFPVDLSVRNSVTTDEDGNEVEEEIDNYRGIGLRGPLVLVGWGFDTHGKPVPNRDFDDAGGKTMEFADNFLRRPDLWKAGPVDLRWDYERNVWTCPPGFKICRAITCCGMESTTGGVKTGKVLLWKENSKYAVDGETIISTSCSNLIDSNSIIDSDDNLPEVIVYNITGKDVPRHVECLVYYDTTEHSGFLFWAPDIIYKCSKQSGVIKVKGFVNYNSEIFSNDSIDQEITLLYPNPDGSGDVPIGILGGVYELQEDEEVLTILSSVNVGCDDESYSETHIIIRPPFRTKEVVTDVSCNASGGLEITTETVRYHGY